MKNLFKVFFTLVKDKEILGESILCEDFYTLEDAKKAGENNMIFHECYFTVREYEEGACIIGGTADTGKEVYSSKRKVLRPFYITLGSSESFPYKNDYIVVPATSEEDAIELFRSKYPDVTPGTCNFSEIYSRKEWLKLKMSSHYNDRPAEILGIPEKAFELINEFCMEEFDSEAGFSDLEDIGVYYTEVDDEEYGDYGIPLQNSVNLIDKGLERYLSTVLIERKSFETVEELLWELENLNESDLLYVTEEQFETYRKNLDTAGFHFRHGEDMYNYLTLVGDLYSKSYGFYVCNKDDSLYLYHVTKEEAATLTARCLESGEKHWNSIIELDYEIVNATAFCADMYDIEDWTGCDVIKKDTIDYKISLSYDMENMIRKAIVSKGHTPSDDIVEKIFEDLYANPFYDPPNEGIRNRVYCFLDREIEKSVLGLGKEKAKYDDVIYEVMKEPYKQFLNDKNSKEELVEMVDSFDIYNLFKDLCEWHGVQPSLVEELYEIFYGKGETKGNLGWFSLPNIF